MTPLKHWQIYECWKNGHLFKWRLASDPCRECLMCGKKETT